MARAESVRAARVPSHKYWASSRSTAPSAVREPSLKPPHASPRARTAVQPLPAAPSAEQDRFELLKALERRLEQEGSSLAASPTLHRMSAVRHAFDLLVAQLPAHGPLLRQVQREFEMVPAGGVPEPMHELLPDHRLLLPGSYYQSELRRAEANLRVVQSHGPRLRRMVRQLRVGCAEARVRLLPFGQVSAVARESAVHLARDELSRIRDELRCGVEPGGPLLGGRISASIKTEVESLLNLVKLTVRRVTASGALLLRTRALDEKLASAIDSSVLSCEALVFDAKLAAGNLIRVVAAAPPAAPLLPESSTVAPTPADAPPPPTESPAATEPRKPKFPPMDGKVLTDLHDALDGLVVQRNALQKLHQQLISREQKVHAAAAKLDREVAPLV